MNLLGDKAWWLPRWLDRIFPNVEVEGESLSRHASGTASAEQDRELAATH